jgi:hypothetical protein
MKVVDGSPRTTTATGSGDAAVTAVADAVHGLTEAAEDLGRRVVAAGVVKWQRRGTRRHRWAERRQPARRAVWSRVR